MITTTRLIHPVCREMKQHMLERFDIGLCCINDYSHDPTTEPRSYTVPIDQVAK